LIWPSSDTDTNFCPSCKNAKLLTGIACPSILFTWPVCMSQMLIIPLRPPAARCVPVGLYAILRQYFPLSWIFRSIFHESTQIKLMSRRWLWTKWGWCTGGRCIVGRCIVSRCIIQRYIDRRCIIQRCIDWRCIDRLYIDRLYINLICVDSGNIERNIQLKGKYCLSIAYSPSGLHLAAGALNGMINICDIQTGQVKSIDWHAMPVRSLAFSHDGQKLVSVSDDGQIKVFEVLVFVLIS